MCVYIYYIHIYKLSTCIHTSRAFPHKCVQIIKQNSFLGLLEGLIPHHSGLNFNVAFSEGPPSTSHLKESCTLAILHSACLFLSYPLTPAAIILFIYGSMVFSHLLLHHQYTLQHLAHKGNAINVQCHKCSLNEPINDSFFFFLIKDNCNPSVLQWVNSSTNCGTSMPPIQLSKEKVEITDEHKSLPEISSKFSRVGGKSQFGRLRTV